MLIPPPPFRPSPAPAVFRGKWRGLALAVCALALLSGPAARGDIQKSSKAGSPGDRGARRQEPPPSAVAGTARVNLDGSVEIVLQSHGGGGQEVDFLIRQPPAHGTLTGPPRQLTRNTVAVTYVHRVGDGPQDDVFTFAVQVLGGKVSAAERVVITVADTAPDLAVSPAELDFGAVNAGDTSRAEITLENRGGGVASGEFAPPAPWEVDGSSSYRLARGERQTFALVFRPVRSASFSENVRLAGEAGGRTVRLIGIGLGSIAAPVAASDPRPPPTATPETSGNVPPAETPPAASTPVPALPAVDPAGPSIPPPAVSALPPRSSLPGFVMPLAVLAGLLVAVCMAFFAGRGRGRQLPLRGLGEPETPAPGRGAPEKEKLNR